MSSKALAAKEKGNASFKAGDFPSAIAHYTGAILEDGKDWTFPLNRAAAYLKLGKNEDAERDCTTVLSLNSGNVKALFRRGQARIGMDVTEKLEEAKKDFEEALRLEPKNDSISSEIEKVKALLSSRRSRRTQPLDIRPTDPSIPRRRIPIKIVRPDGSIAPESSVSSSGSTSEQPAKITVLPSPPSPSLLPPKSDESSPTPVPSTSPPTASTSTSSPQPKTFQDAKRARDAKESQKPQTQSTQSTKAAEGQRIYAETPTVPRTSPVSGRVGGGIFRASGKKHIFESRENKPRIEEVDADDKKTKATVFGGGKEQASRGDQNYENANMTLFDFDAKWQQLESSEEKFEFLTTVPPSRLPTMFQTSLEPSLFMSICRTLLDAIQHSDDENIVTVAVEYLQTFTKVPRIKTVVLFLTGDEKDVLRAIYQRLEVSERVEIREIVETCRAIMKV
ncbi:hypothetical protein D9758_001714 [Tetrapyrgos nigripes]|uniref:RNA polymerase II-associated protein 3 n=1 Tax=Tetrapyrgos nigripes TaxID=182062 RepID=A0A8H5LXE4_9AGAR|nr:hypothetical protein D9758_001714 [Tetrapyrgos nigripes]